MPETLFVLYPGEHFLVMALDGSVTRYRAQSWGIERMDNTGQVVIGTEEGRFDAQEEGDPGVPTGDSTGEAGKDRG